MFQRLMSERYNLLEVMLGAVLFVGSLLGTLYLLR